MKAYSHGIKKALTFCGSSEVGLCDSCDGAHDTAEGGQLHRVVFLLRFAQHLIEQIEGRAEVVPLGELSLVIQFQVDRPQIVQDDFVLFVRR